MRQFLVFAVTICVFGACASQTEVAKREVGYDLAVGPKVEVQDQADAEFDSKPRTMAVVDERFSGRIEVRPPVRFGWEFDDNDEDDQDQIVIKNDIMNAQIVVQPYSTDDGKAPEERLSEIFGTISRSAETVGSIRTNRMGTIASMDFVEENESKGLTRKKIALVTFPDLPNLFVHVQGEWSPEDEEEMNRDFETVVDNISAVAF